MEGTSVVMMPSGSEGRDRGGRRGGLGQVVHARPPPMTCLYPAKIRRMLHRREAVGGISDSSIGGVTSRAFSAT